jgi:Domain of unknown function (DUF4381)
MDNRKMRRIFLTVVSGCCAFLFSVAQPVVKTTSDKNEILIGQQFAVKFQAVFSGEDYYIKWVTVPDSLQHFELVEKSKIDSVFTNQKLSGLSQTFTLTSFDSGKWIFPSFKISFSPVKDDTTLSIFTDSLPVTVSYSVADTTSTLKDIKAIREVEVFNPVWYWVAGVLLLLLIVCLIVWWYCRNKKNVKLQPLLSKLSPYEEAMQELGKLKTFNLSVPKEVQQYHNRLIEIFRHYLSRKENTDYLNKTTSDILINLKNSYLNKNITDKAAAALRFSNAVKFAKYIPPVADNEANQQLVKETIDLIESSAIKK